MTPIINSLPLASLLLPDGRLLMSRRTHLHFWNLWLDDAAPAADLVTGDALRRVWGDTCVGKGWMVSLCYVYYWCFSMKAESITAGRGRTLAASCLESLLPPLLTYGPSRCSMPLRTCEVVFELDSTHSWSWRPTLGGTPD